MLLPSSECGGNLHSTLPSCTAVDKRTDSLLPVARCLFYKFLLFCPGVAFGAFPINQSERCH